MTLFKPLFLVPVASLFFAAGIGSGACSSSTTVTLPTSSTPPNGVTFAAGTFGGHCVGDIYATAGVGYAFCDDGTWEYTTTDPSQDAFTEVSSSADGGSGTDGATMQDGGQNPDAGQQGIDAQAPTDATTATDATTGTDAAQGVDGGQQGGGTQG